MTSDKAGQSEAREKLDYAMGAKRVSLAQLTAAEFDEVLGKLFSEIDLRGLRGFVPLRELLSKTPGSSVTGQRQNPLEVVSVSPDVRFVEDREPDLWKDPVSHSTHFLPISRGAAGIHEMTFRRYESGEETTEYEVAKEWGNAFVRKVSDSLLVLRRPVDYKSPNDALYRLVYVYEKVLHKDEMVVTHVGVRRIPLAEFRTVLGNDYPEVASGMISELSLQHRRTIDQLRSKISRFEIVTALFERWNGATMA